MYKIVYFLILTAIFSSCATHVERLVMIPPGENGTDSIHVYMLEKKKSEGKILIIFQPQESHDTKTHLQLARVWKKRGFDVIMPEYPYPDNPLLRKSSVNLSTRMYDYATVYQHFTEKTEINTTHYLAIEYGLPWALSLGEMFPPDVLVIHKAGILTPYQNLKLVMNGDTLSTDDTWQPADKSVSRQDAFEQLEENLKTKSFSGAFEFDNVSDVLWNEMETLNISDQIAGLKKAKVFWVMPENYHKMSRIGMELLQSYTFSFGAGALRFYDAKEPEQLHEIFESILENIETP
jgi:hypothetical protein